MATDLDDLATALYVTCDDLLNAHPERRSPPPPGGFTARISDAELLTVATMQALLGYTSERRWLRFAHRNLRPLFPALPQQPGYNKRLRALAPTMAWKTRTLATLTSVGDDDVWVADSTPVEWPVPRDRTAFGTGRMGRVRLLRLTLPLLLGLASAPAHHRPRRPCGLDPHRSQSRRTSRPTRHSHRTTGLADLVEANRPTIIADKGYYGHQFETELADAGITVLRPARKGEPPRSGEQFFKPLRQIIESVNETLKGQLDLERHGGRTTAGVFARIAQRILAMAAAIWHNDTLGKRIRRSLTAYDH
ncbi:putative transposase [Gordonia hirsuta DSM 44140 = NBRC 16056]|uniref:Putative transposase n=1 Tax=Gordonia hirsuta DSM 44140 = NBRC 16056 TaxID=1121927 RepID=L7LAF4_9ACTN|nr:transposase [Gordonia hirsuta]GAC58120.1 putative transposase [Gordonia hirsuta DSM 44140 = NBRC 16056]